MATKKFKVEADSNKPAKTPKAKNRWGLFSDFGMKILNETFDTKREAQKAFKEWGYTKDSEAWIEEVPADAVGKFDKKKVDSACGKGKEEVPFKPVQSATTKNIKASSDKIYYQITDEAMNVIDVAPTKSKAIALAKKLIKKSNEDSYDIYYVDETSNSESDDVYVTSVYKEDVNASTNKAVKSTMNKAVKSTMNRRKASKKTIKASASAKRRMSKKAIKASTSGNIPYDLVSMLVVLRDWVDISDDNYINSEHKALVDMSDAFYNMPLSIVSMDNLAEQMEPANQEIYNKYGKSYFYNVLKDASAIDSQISRSNVNDLIADYNDRATTFDRTFDAVQSVTTKTIKASASAKRRASKRVTCAFDEGDPWEYQESYDYYYDEEPPAHIAKELGRLAKLTDMYTDRWFEKFEELHPGERFSSVYPFPDVDEAVGYTLDEAEYSPDDIKASTEVNADLQLSRDKSDRKKYNWSDNKNDITDIDGYVQDIAEGVVERFPSLSYEITDEAITFTDENGAVVYIQPIDEIVPEQDDLDNDITELGDAIQHDNEEADWFSQEQAGDDDPDYATRAVTMSEEYVDVEDMDYITGEEDEEWPAEDLGFGYDSNGDPINESTVEELNRIAQEIVDKSEIAKYDRYADVHNFDFYMSSPYVNEKFDLTFTPEFTSEQMSANKFVNLSESVQDINAYYKIYINVRVKSGEVADISINDVECYVNNNRLSIVNIDEVAIKNWVGRLVAPVAKEIYVTTANL